MPTNRLPVLLHPGSISSLLNCDWLKVLYVGDEDKYAEGHIPGSLRISHKDLNHGVAPCAGHLPATEQLERLFRSIGLEKEHHVVCCDEDSGTAAARLFWVLEAMGHHQVSFLDGGMLAWRAKGLGLSTVPAECQVSNWSAAPNPDVLATKEYVINGLDNPQIQILDARSEEEYGGIKSASDRRGHIPQSISMNWLNTRDPHLNNQFKPLTELQEMLNEAGLKQSSEIIAHCQTHQRSSHSYVMLRALGYNKVRGFAGSWSEWAADNATPIVDPQRA